MCFEGWLVLALLLKPAALQVYLNNLAEWGRREVSDEGSEAGALRYN